MSNLKSAFNLSYNKLNLDAFLGKGFTEQNLQSEDSSYEHFDYSKIKSYLEELVNTSQSSLTVNVDGLKLQNMFFPDFVKEKDTVFLSHSSKDVKEAYKIKEEIEKKKKV